MYVRGNFEFNLIQGAVEEIHGYAKIHTSLHTIKHIPYGVIRWQWGELWCIVQVLSYCMWLQYWMQWGRRQRSAGADVGRYVSATYGCRPLERLKVSEVTGVRGLSSRPNLASIVVLVVLSAFYRTPPPIISYAVCIHHTWTYRYHSYQCIHIDAWSMDTYEPFNQHSPGEKRLGKIGSMAARTRLPRQQG